MQSKAFDTMNIAPAILLLSRGFFSSYLLDLLLRGLHGSAFCKLKQSLIERFVL